MNHYYYYINRLIELFMSIWKSKNLSIKVLKIETIINKCSDEHSLQGFLGKKLNYWNGSTLNL